MHNRARLTALAAITATVALLLTGCIPSGPPTLDQVNAEFAQPITPAWQVDVDGVFGEPAVADGMVAVYAQDDTVGLRLEVHSTDTGKLLWKHTASPGGAWASPLFEETNSASRAYPVPTIQPLVVKRGSGDDAKWVVVYFEREITHDSIVPDDFLRVADLATGKELKVTIPGFDPDVNYLDSARITDDGELAFNPYGPGWVCDDGPTICFDDMDQGYVRLDLGSLEVSLTARVVPDDDRDYTIGFGQGYYSAYTDDDVQELLRIKDQAVLWDVPTTELFDQGMSPPTYIDFVHTTGQLLVQGYRSILTNTDLDNQLSLDYAESRRVAALDPDTGERSWLLKGGDQFCYAVAQYNAPADAAVRPMCRVTSGSFTYAPSTGTMLDQKDAEVSVVGVKVADGSIAWEVPHAGEQSILHVARELDAVFASRGQFASVLTAPKKPGLIDLNDGKVAQSPDKSTFVCKSERNGVQLEFEGSAFLGGLNPIALEYPAGWFAYACDLKSAAADGPLLNGKDPGDIEPPKIAWSKGAVRVAGYPAGDGRVILLTKTGIAGFTL